MEPEINPEIPLAAVLFVALAFAGKAVGSLVADSGAVDSAARNALVIEDLRLSMNTPRPPTIAAAQAPTATHLPIGVLEDFFDANVGLGDGVDGGVPQSNDSSGFDAC